MRLRTRIKSNKARCLVCDDIVESKLVHDFVACRCGAIFVDGGHDYLRRGGDPGNIEDLSETEYVGQEMFPVEDWQYEVGNGDTLLGYREWLEHQIEGLPETEHAGEE